MIVHRRVVEISLKGELVASLPQLDEVEVSTDRGVTRLRAVVRDDSAEATSPEAG